MTGPMMTRRTLLRGLGVTMAHFFENTKQLVTGQRPDPVLEALSTGVAIGAAAAR